MAGDKTLCNGCRDDYYNSPGHSEKGCCWSLESAEVVTRYRLGWWTAPTEQGAFTKVTTNSCWHAPGKFAHYKALPDFVEAAERARVDAERRSE